MFDSKNYLILVKYYCNIIEIEEIIDRLKKEINFHRVIIVSNGGETGVVLNNEFISGTNNLLDMSGYYEGLEYLWEMQKIEPQDIIVFANDSIYRKHPIDYLAKAANEFLKKREKSKDCYAGVLSDFVVDDVKFEYFSTYFFLVNNDVLKKALARFGKSLLKNRGGIRKIKKFVGESDWEPYNEKLNNEIYIKKKKCVLLEMTYSMYARDVNIFTALPNGNKIKAMRFCIKCKNYLNKLINRKCR